MIERVREQLREVIGGQGLKSVLIKGASLVFLIRIVGAGLQYFSEIFLARILGAEVYGAYVYAISWAILLAIPAGLGLSTGVIRYLPEYDTNEQKGLFKGLLIQSWSITLGTGIIIALISSFIVKLYGPGLSSGLGITLVLGFCIIPLKALLSLQQGLSRAINRMALAFAPQLIFLPILIVSSLYVFHEYGGRVNIVNTLVIVFFCYILSVGGQFLIFLKHSQKIIKNEKAKFKVWSWLRASFPFLLSASFMIVIQRSDLILVGAMAGTDQAGLYNAATRTSSLVGFILSAVNAIAAPTIAKLYAEKKIDAMRKLATKIAQFVFWPSLVIGIVLSAGSSIILSFFGSEFIKAQAILITLICGQLISCSVGSVGTFMKMTGNQDQNAKVFGISALINILLNIVGIYLFGPIGAAIASAITWFIWNVWLYVLVKKELNIDSSIFSTFK